MFFSHRSVKETSVFLNKSVYLGLLILELSKILICEFLHNFVKPKYREKPKLRYMNTGNFIAYKKQRTFTELLQMMMKQDLILQIIN